MSQKTLSLLELLDLIELEDYRGIISKDAVLETVKTKGALPTYINDVRGAVRLTVERDGGDFSVTQHDTACANETIGEIYPAAANDNGIDAMDQAA